MQDYVNPTMSDTKADIVKLLIDHGADVTAQDETWSTPLHLAAYCGSSTQTMRLLIEHGADVTAQDRNNKTPLHSALSKVNFYPCETFNLAQT